MTLIVFAIGMLLMLIMYLAHEVRAKDSELLKAELGQMQSVDKYLLKILKTFSGKTVEDHIFRGIMPKKEQVSIEFRDLCATYCASKAEKAIASCLGKKAEDKRILTGVSGRFEAGHVAAIMGTSGAGKTTFLNLLCGKIAVQPAWSVTGTVCINGEPAELTSLKNVMGFVPQEDTVHELMTVRENIKFSAELRCARGTSQRKLHRITNDVLEVLQLEAQQNIRVGNRTTGKGLSGGQRKRVNVGLELAACPTLLFLDEPTSGLDSTGSLMLVRQLQKMTDLGMTIVMVIHQPRYSLFTLINDVLLLGKGGRTAFIGPTSEAKQYFENLGFTMPPNENPADWMMDVMAGQAEVDNPRIPRDALPERLYTEWEEYEKRKWRVCDLKRGRTVPLTQVEDGEIVKAQLRDAWKSIDPPANTALDSAKLSQVLQRCTGVEPSSMIMEELIMRLETAAARRPNGSHTPNHVKHLEFEQYLLAVHQGGARLQSVLSVSHNSAEIDSAEAEAGAVSESASEDEGLDAMRKSLRDGQNNQDLARVLPGFCAQLKTVITRASIAWWRKQKMRLMFLLVVEFAAVFLGVFDRFVFHSPPWMATNYVNAQISMALLVSVYSLSTFGAPDELPIFWRESSHGLNRLSFFIGKMLLQLIDQFLMVFGFATAYYLVMAPAMPYPWYVIVFHMVGYVASGWGFFISCWLPYNLIALGPFVSALLSFVFGGILGLPTEMSVYLTSPICQLIVDATSFTRWGAPMVFFQYLRFNPPSIEGMDIKEEVLYNMTVTDYALGWEFEGDKNHFWTGLFALLLCGTVLRVLAFFGLMRTNRSRQI